MKKLISVLLLLALVLSFCACGQEPSETTPATEPSVEATTEELSGGHKYDTEVEEATKPDCSNINEFEPNEDGVYQIHTPEGLMNIINHPDAEFELLWHIDMGGITWTPVGTKAQPFTGKIEGGYFTVSNFVIDTPNADGDLGFFGTFAGQVKELTLKDVTITTTADTQRAGLWCAHNDDGQFLRCGNETSSLTAAQMAQNAAIGAIVGVNEGDFRNGTMDTSLTVTAAGKADVGGIAGYAADGKIQFIKNHGFIEVTGSDKNVGLFAGSITKDAQLNGCVYLGEKNTQDGVLFDNFTGTGDAEKVTECLYRDNTKAERDPVNLEKRETVADYMRRLCSIEWTVPADRYYNCKSDCRMIQCNGVLRANYPIVGSKYNHKVCSLAKVMYALDENNVMKQEVMDMASFDGWDCYIGSDCTGTISHALWTVVATPTEDSFSLNRWRAMSDNQFQTIGIENLSNPDTTEPYMLQNGEQGIYEAYAQAQIADIIWQQVELGCHVRLLTGDPVVVRNEAGEIDGMESYLTTTEMGAPRTFEPYMSFTRVDYQYTFTSLFNNWYIPMEQIYLRDSVFPEPDAWLEDGVDGKFGMTTGVVHSTMYLDSVELIITDETGAEVFSHRQFNNTTRWYDDQGKDEYIRNYYNTFDLAKFAIPLQQCMLELGKTYNYTLTTYLGSEDAFVVKEGSFTNGTAK